MMNTLKHILAAGCLVLMLAAPVTAYANPPQTNPGEGVTVSASSYENVAISQVTNYVNVRTAPNRSSDIVGKIYNNCAATILAAVDGEGGTWYQIQSGTVNGYIKAQYFLTGAEAEAVARQIGTTFVRINTDTLRLREQPSTNSHILTLLSRDAEYIVLEETGDFVHIQVDASMNGYVHKDYIEKRVELACAVSLAEEQQQKDEAARLQKEAEDAIAAMNQIRTETQNTQPSQPSDAAGQGEQPADTIPANPDGLANITINPDGSAGQTADPVGVGSTAGPGAPVADGSSVITGEAANPAGPGAPTVPAESAPEQSTSASNLTAATRTAIVAYAKQFLGNPYVYGGTSLTNGADCSGFTMKLFEHFGIDTGRSSRDQAAKGKKISIDSVQPGDLLFYASGDYINHVGMYIGGGQIIHAGTKKTGISICSANYRTPYMAATFLE